MRPHGQRPGFYDALITFGSVGGSPVPTSHHNIVKNVSIGIGQFSLAEGFDDNIPTRPVVLVRPSARSRARTLPA